MSAQRLSPKSTRRIERATGLQIVRAWSHGGYTFDFVIADAESPVHHWHGQFDKKTGEWSVALEPDVTHYDTCKEMFP